ncbi:uncharacterized protein Aud_001724 [Aspergillus udagawae]|uniref:Uncharacterized protein n=1 Tax=Aspergillus udagawae TaxID=91492 RepID=A0A8E0QJE9_9EURO|nr:uncharacterized protein Aud_001724 [Aspergillus udagawae]GIC85884.1 hypothetical protein Aud_001724 [Aspergillus udagawae]
MANSFVPLEPTTFLPAAKVPNLLGRFCVYPREPTRNSFPLNPQPFYCQNNLPYCVEASDPSIILENISDLSIRASMAKFLKLNFDTTAKAKTKWKGSKVRVFTLPSEDTVMANMLADKNLRDLVNGNLKDGNGLYLVVGFMAFVNATFESHNRHEVSANLELNLGKAIEAALKAHGVPLQVPDINAYIGEHNRALHQWQATFIDETIVAVKYRYVTRKKYLLWKCQKGEVTLRDVKSVKGARMFGEPDDAEAQLLDLKCSLKWNKNPDTLEDGDEILIAPVEKIPFDGASFELDGKIDYMHQ